MQFCTFQIFLSEFLFLTDRSISFMWYAHFESF